MGMDSLAKKMHCSGRAHQVRGYRRKQKADAGGPCARASEVLPWSERGAQSKC